MTPGRRPAVGLAFAGGVIVDITGGKWGIVEYPDGRRSVRDVSFVIAADAGGAPERPPRTRPPLPLVLHGFEEVSDPLRRELLTLAVQAALE